MHEELLDIVDHNDQVIGQATRSYVNAHIHDKCFRGINVFIENDRGQLWIPRRTAHKFLFPSSLDFSVGGCVAAGESYEDAFAREVLEEVNLDITKISYTYAAYFSPFKHDVSFFLKVYKIHSNVTPHFNPDDFSEYFWMSPQELLERCAQGEPCKSDLPKVVKLVYGGNL